ncbi:MAG: ATP-binding protein [Alphaproteobacteria bacterium]
MRIPGIPFLRSRHLPRFLVVSGAALLTGILAILAVAVVWLRDQALSDSETRLAQLNLALAEQVERSFGAIETVQRTIASVAQRGDLFEPATRAGMHTYLASQTAGLPQVRAFLVMDRDGDLVIDSTSAEPRAYNGADRENFQVLKSGEQGDLHIGAPLFGRLTQQWLFTVSRRLEGPDGEFSGIVTGNVDLAYFVEFFGAMKLGEDGTISLWRKDGAYLLGSPLNEPMLGRILDQGPIHKEFLPHVAAAVLRAPSPIDGTDRMISFHALKDYQAFVVVSRGMDAVLAPWVRQTAALALFAGLSILVLGGFGYVLLRMAQAQDRLLLEAHEARAAAEHSAKVAEEANRLKSRFFAGVSHDLRTPLNAIAGFSDLLLSGHGGALSDKTREYVADIRQSGRHLLELLNELLDMAKIEAGRMTLVEDRFALRSLIAECVRLSAPLAAKAGVQVKTAGETDFGLRADQTRLRQILFNLLSNAIKFTPEGGHVEIAASRAADGSLRVAVTDNGIGMDKAGIAAALEPFGQVDNGFTRHSQGTGLGLPMAKALIELHGGWLEIKSAPGKGSSFTMVLPAERVLTLAARVA